VLPCSTSLCSKLSCKSCRSKLLRPCPITQNSLRLSSTAQQKYKKILHNLQCIVYKRISRSRNYGSTELRSYGRTELRIYGATELRNYGTTETWSYGEIKIFLCFCFLEASTSFGCVLVSIGRWCKFTYKQIHSDSRTRACKCQAFKKGDLGFLFYPSSYKVK